MQALILVGGEGTRLRPLTSTIPKPVVTLVDRPFLAYMLEWLRGHGVDDVILSCGFKADGVRTVLGDGSSLGIRIRYVEEPEPLGTGGALKYAEDLLDERFFMLNGDVLTDMDLTAQLREHEDTGARATLALIGVDDPSAYGLVRRHPNGAVSGFLEKPSVEEIDTNLVNAGAYILQREVLAEMAPAGTRISIERDVFPVLVGNGLYGHESSGYWMDIGTPQRYLQATYDILENVVSTEVGRRIEEGHGIAFPDEPVRAQVHSPALLGAGCRLSDDTTIAARCVIGPAVEIGAGAHIEGSVLLEGSRVGARTRISGSVVGPNVRIGDDCRLSEGVVLGERVQIGSGNTLRGGMRIFPGVQLPDRAVSF